MYQLHESFAHMLKIGNQFLNTPTVSNANKDVCQILENYEVLINIAIKLVHQIYVSHVMRLSFFLFIILVMPLYAVSYLQCGYLVFSKVAYNCE